MKWSIGGRAENCGWHFSAHFALSFPHPVPKALCGRPEYCLISLTASSCTNRDFLFSRWGERDNTNMLLIWCAHSYKESRSTTAFDLVTSIGYRGSRPTLMDDTYDIIVYVEQYYCGWQVFAMAEGSGPTMEETHWFSLIPQCHLPGAFIHILFLCLNPLRPYRPLLDVTSGLNDSINTWPLFDITSDFTLMHCDLILRHNLKSIHLSQAVV